MKPITDKTKWPKFLRVNNVAEGLFYNGWLTKPWATGEIVKVIPFDEQKSSVGPTDEHFRSNYVNVLRKDKNGEWKIRYNWTWDIFEPLKKI